MTKITKNYFWLLLCFVATSMYAQSGKLQFTYDTAGNQIKREFCEGSCSVSAKSTEEINEETETFADLYDDHLIMYPNPTNGKLNIEWGTIQQENLVSISLVNYLGVALQQVQIDKTRSALLDLSAYPTGVYLAQFRFSDKSIFSQKIIKK